jgi:hypothetical protein
MLQRFALPAKALAGCLAMLSAVACGSNAAIDSPNAPSLAATTARQDTPVDPPVDPPKGGQGCTPGYWKQPQHADSWAVYAPGDSFNATFGVSVLPDTTLLQALGLNGGGMNALARHATAALLNSANGSVSYGMTQADVISAVQAAVASGDVEAAKNIFAGLNEKGCPIN